MGGGGGGDDDGLSIEDGTGTGGGKLVVEVGLLVPMAGSVLPALADGISVSMPGRGDDGSGIGGMFTDRDSFVGGRLEAAPGAPFSLRSELRVVLGKPLTLASCEWAASGVAGAPVAGGMPPALLTSLP